MSLATPPKVRKLQETLHAKAKSAPNYRFYLLYDKMYGSNVLAHAYACCRANGGACGVDGVDFDGIEACGVERWLGELTEDLRKKTYRPQPVRRVYIPKPNGQRRPLGIPTVRDRVVQMAMVLVLGPIFENDLLPEQYAYRPNRSARDAVIRVVRLLEFGYREVVDADLSGYFDSIPHAELMKSVTRRISDRHVLRLIKMWLQLPVEETDQRGRRRRTCRNRDEGRGTPQGAPISPLLANLYMRRFLLGWRQLGFEKRLKAYVVNYADDFVICCRGTAEAAATVMRDMMQKLKLTVNESKTSVRRVPNETFNFLGYTFGRCYSPRTGNAYIGAYPSRNALRRVRRTIHEMTERRRSRLSIEDMVPPLNRLLVGWANYYSLGLGPIDRSYRAIDAHMRRRFRQWLRRKYLLQGSGASRWPDKYLYGELGLVQLQGRPLRYS